MQAAATERRPQKTLAVFDLDNTLTDTLSFWAAAITPVARALERDFGIDARAIENAILKAPSQYRFNDIERLVGWLDQRGLFPRAKDLHEQHQIDMTKWALSRLWHMNQRQLTHFYPDALQSLQQIKAAGTSVALYTDAEAAPMIKRVWMMAHNARRAGLIAREDEVLNLFDHFYAQQSAEDDQAILRNVDLHFVLKMKQKTSIWTQRLYKPAPPLLQIIMDDFAATPEQTVMVGDTQNDGGGAVPLGVAFAWAHYGAVIAPDVERTAQRMASPHYKYGAENIRAAFAAHNRPDVILNGGLSALLAHYDFKGGLGFNPHNAASANAPRHNHGDQAWQNPLVYRLHNPLRSHTPQSPLGPATHAPPGP